MKKGIIGGGEKFSRKNRGEEPFSFLFLSLSLYFSGKIKGERGFASLITNSVIASAERSRSWTRFERVEGGEKMHYSSSVNPRHLRRFLQRLIACKISRFLILIVTHFAFAVTLLSAALVKIARASVPAPFNHYQPSLSPAITIFTRIT